MAQDICALLRDAEGDGREEMADIWKKEGGRRGGDRICVAVIGEGY